MIDSRLFFDTSAWLEYLLGLDDRMNEFFETSAILFTSVLSLYEIKKKLIQMRLDHQRIKYFLNFIKTRSLVLDLNADLCELAAELSITNHLHASDSLIYTSALSKNAKLITYDSDFTKCSGVLVLERK